jgi:hypothetical protein
MRKVKVISKKYDGSLRDEYETYLYAETDEIIILLSLPGLSYWDHRKAAGFEAPDGLLEIYIINRACVRDKCSPDRFDRSLQSVTARPDARVS